jgi:hypothetical protein
MPYTDYTQKEIFTDRQRAIESSRTKAKDEFFNSLVEVSHIYEPDGEICTDIDRKVSDYKDIKKVFEAYEKNRATIYELKIELPSIF